MSDKILVVAEKPSVIVDIARALGGLTRGKDCYEGEKYIVSSAVGHLLEIIAPEGVEVKRGKWSLQNLPVLPDYFELRPIKSTAERLRVLTRLYNRKDVGSIINACDAGREGELIFHNLVRYLTEGKKKPAKPIQRLWLRSMTPTAIRRGFEGLRPHEDLQPLRHAAICRSEADWLVGINGTRAMTALHSTAGGFSLTTVGRVQTPTLAIIVERERHIKAFEPQQYWEIYSQFKAEAGCYEGIWTAVADKKAPQKPERIFSRQEVDRILADCLVGKIGVVTETKKPATEAPPPLFDLTSLQRDANARFGFSARSTLSIAQALYERHKLITYPRTDSRALPEDYPSTVTRTLSALTSDATIGHHAQQVLEQGWVGKAGKRVFNNAKVSDHFAIVPTGERASLKDNESKLYDLIVRRFVAVFFPIARFLVTERRTQVGEHCFITKGRILQEAGWRAVAAQVTKDTIIIPVQENEKVPIEEIAEKEKVTLPPPRYNEATLLSAMEGAGKRVEDEELREAMRERGLGTPATRASIIEGLLKERYLIRDRRDLIATPKADSLLRLLSALKVDALTLPSLTGEWEYQLRRIEKADMDRQSFMQGIRQMTTSLIDAAKSCGDVEAVAGDFSILTAPCPACQGEMRESHRRFSCSSCPFFIWKAMAGRELSQEEVETLLRDHRTGELEGFRSRLGREFSATICLQKNEDDQWRATFDFGDSQKASTLTEADLADKVIIGPCPKCEADVRDVNGRYLCQRSIGDQAACDFSLGGQVLQQEITHEQARLLLTEGKTSFLEKFISKRTRRPFKAKLTMNLNDKSGKIAFEFAPRRATSKK